MTPRSVDTRADDTIAQPPPPPRLFSRLGVPPRCMHLALLSSIATICVALELRLANILGDHLIALLLLLIALIVGAALVSPLFSKRRG